MEERGREMEYTPITIEQVVSEESTDERYHLYRPAIPLQIFHSVIEPDADAENCSMEVSVQYDLQQMLPVINSYLQWLACCEDEVTAYFEQCLGEKVPADWFDTIEVYSVSLVFNSADDYGATVEFGESVISDHIIEFQFEKQEIVGDVMSG